MKRFRDVFIGVIIGCILMISTPVLADSIMTKIDAILNAVNVQVEGTDVEVNSILYDGSTYLPIRKVAELVGKDIEWNQETMTANIVEKIKEGDNVNENEVSKDDVVTKTENGIIINGVEYYEARYIAEQINGVNDCSIEYMQEDRRLRLVIYSDSGAVEEVLIDKIPVVEYGITKLKSKYISKDYYENTMLSLINK